ncbi:hypothetical protein GRF29_44g61570 [Pseudopithomyces chartarum]|uniref:NADAR domain-containing protein n=1 Tax=Pseudopithomyces chartarum TaxID=1892770 RepID=A0AAN6M1Z4_9PLEO|nr:hypothetical protein GRF29_44g61570 [Pseudopithomyces chartarum]
MPKAKRKAVAKGQMETRSKSAAGGKAATSSKNTTKRKPTTKAKKSARSKQDEEPKIRVVIPRTSRTPPFFFSTDPDSEGGFLSPWYTCPYKYGNKTVISAGQLITACRAEIARDMESYEKILAATSEEEIKALADNIKGFSNEEWANHPDYTEHIYGANQYKFLHSEQSEDLLNRLAKLGDRELVFTDPTDSYLGNHGEGMNKASLLRG